MWLLRTIFAVVIAGVFVVIALENNGPPMTVRFFQLRFENVHPFVVIFTASFLGFLVGLLVCAIREIRLRIDLSRVRKENALLAREVADLRAAPLRDLDIPSPEPDTRRLRSRVTP